MKLQALYVCTDRWKARRYHASVITRPVALQRKATRERKKEETKKTVAIFWPARNTGAAHSTGQASMPRGCRDKGRSEATIHAL